MKEIFRAQNVQLELRDGSACSLSFNLIEGELLGVHIPRIQQELSVISKAVMRDTTVKSGSLFYYETEFADEPPARGWPSVACVQTKSSLVEEMSVMDNLFLLRRRKNRGGLYSNRRLMREAARQMEAFGLPFLPHQTVRSLSRMEKHTLEIFKAYLHGADIIILDQIAWEASTNDIVKMLLRLIKRLKSEGVTFIIISDRLNNLRSCADRIAFYDGTQIVSILENIPENQPMITETFNALVRNLAQERHHRITYLERGEQIEFNNPILASLNLVRGEKVALYDPMGVLYRYMENRKHRKHVPLAGGYILTERSKWNKWNEHPRTIVADFGCYDQLFEFLPVMDNLLLGRSDGMKMLHIVGNKYRNMLKREFSERFGEPEMLEIKESSSLTPEQRFMLYLFKLMLINPDVVLAWRCPKADPVLVNLLESTMAQFTEDQKTVCYLSRDVFERMEDAERYILVTNNGVESYRTYGELLDRQMLRGNANWRKMNDGDMYG